MELSKRLKRLIELLPCGEVAADIGCDHAYAAISLIEEGKYQKVIASDLRKGPLESARKNIAEKGYSDKIETRLYDGLKGVNPFEADAILIAGMGGATMRQILQERSEVAKSAKVLLLQPQSELYEFRVYLREDGYEIIEEDMVFDDGKYYPMMLVRPGKASDDSTKEVFDHFGKLLLERKHPVLKAYLMHLRDVKMGILEKLSSAPDSVKNEMQKQEVEALLSYIQEALSYYA